MKVAARSTALAVFLLGLGARGAAAWRLFGEPSDKRIRPIQALSDAGKPAEVVAALRSPFMQTLRGTDLRQAYVLLGDNLLLLGHSDDALSVYQLGVSLFPKNVDLLTRQAGLLHRIGLDERARPLFLKALEVEPNHFGAHLGLAEIERALGSFEKAAQDYEDALETLEKRPDVWRDYAEVLLALNDIPTADLALHKALELDPKSPDTHVLLGFARRAQGDFNGATARLDEALSLGAGIGARRAKALWLLEAGKPAAASAEAEKILRQAPADAVALWVRARTAAARGDLARASADLSAMKLENGNGGFAGKAAAALLARLREKR